MVMCRVVFWFGFLLIVVFVGVGCDSEVEREQQGVEDVEKWRGLDHRPQGAPDWVPADSPISSEVTEPVVKRRRVRKRKRRPQNFEQDEDLFNDRSPPRPRIRRPIRLDQQREEWREEMMSEEPFRPLRPYKRRRLYPKYEENEQENGETGGINNNNNEEIVLTESQIRVADEEKQQTTQKILVQAVEKVRDPYTALQEETRKVHFPRRKLKDQLNKIEELPISEQTPQETKTIEPSTTYAPIDLKALLKQAGGISLSELLQRKNLSLNDLLKGERHAISALTHVDDIIEKPRKVEKKTNDNDMETTTERRIFVPSHPKFYTSVNFKPDMKDLNVVDSTSVGNVNEDENSVESTLPSATKPTKPVRTRVTLPPTLAKLRNKYSKTMQRPVVPDNAIKIGLNELFGIGSVVVQTKPEEKTEEMIVTDRKVTTEGPLKISVGIQEADDDNVTVENTVEAEETSTEYREVPKAQATSARDEIQEILSDTMSREQLLTILEARNMTLDELLEQRERGSSQRHLADIFHNKTKEPEAKEELVVSQIIKNKMPTKPVFLEHSTYEIRQIYPPKIDDVSREPRQNLKKPVEEYNIINNPLFRTDSKKTNEVINKLIPVWRQAYTNIHKQELDNDILLKDEALRVEEIENQIAEAVNGALNIDTLPHKTTDDDSYFQLPSGVRSAVIASATIVGISVFVFVTIFIIFKCSQKRNQHLSYSNSLSSLKLRSPILETQYQKRIFGSLMNSTLGRKKKLSTVSSSEPHSLQDYLWENDRKPFQ